MKNSVVGIASILSMLLIFFMSCEDVIDVELEEGVTSLVVDAWVNNLPQDQKIVLNLSQPYFDNINPPIVNDASILLTRNDGRTFTFNHQEGGKYIWHADGDSLGLVGHSFQLEIQYSSEVYIAETEMFRVPQIDSIGIEFREDELFFDDGLYAQFFARDMPGLGDTYWIRTYRNDEYLAKSQEINLAFDAGFDAGTGIDGLIFIPPIRELVNPLNEDLISTPYDTGDVIRVEIHSISNEAFNFMEIVRDQINNGDNGIFAIPLANARTNIMASDYSQVLGFFNVAAVASRSKIIAE